MTTHSPLNEENGLESFMHKCAVTVLKKSLPMEPTIHRVDEFYFYIENEAVPTLLMLTVGLHFLN